MTDYAFLSGTGFTTVDFVIEVWELTTLTSVGSAVAPPFASVIQAPGAVRINHAGTKLYVTNGQVGGSAGGLLGVFDLPALTFNTWIDLSSVCTGAVGIAIDSSDTYAYVTGMVTGSVTQVDLASNAVVGNCTGFSADPTFGIAGVTVDAGGAYVYLVDPAPGNMVQIDTSTMTVVASVNTFGLGDQTAIDIEPAGGNLWVGAFTQVPLPLTGAANFYPGPASESYYPGAVKLNHAGTKAYLITDSAPQFWEINTSTFTLHGPTALSGDLTDIAITPSNGHAVVAVASGGFQIFLIDLTTYAVVPASSGIVASTYGAAIGNYNPSPPPSSQIVMLL